MVLKTKQASSSDARANILNQDFEIFHPTFRMRAVHGVRRIAALFPFYLMVRVDDATQNWRSLCSTRGVSYVLMDGEDRPGRVSDQVIADLKTLTDDSSDGYYHDPLHDPPRFAAGSAVRGTHGLFVGKFGIYQGLAGNRDSRVRVLFNVLGRESEFELNATDLAAA